LPFIWKSLFMLIGTIVNLISCIHQSLTPPIGFGAGHDRLKYLFHDRENVPFSPFFSVRPAKCNFDLSYCQPSHLAPKWMVECWSIQQTMFTGKG
jgi:hypothetical protein